MKSTTLMICVFTLAFLPGCQTASSLLGYRIGNHSRSDHVQQLVHTCQDEKSLLAAESPSTISNKANGATTSKTVSTSGSQLYAGLTTAKQDKFEGNQGAIRSLINTQELEFQPQDQTTFGELVLPGTINSALQRTRRQNTSN